jgi:glyoxylase-like metal-dependent hydrolase (beta-lactamase superfamily II)
MNTLNKIIILALSVGPLLACNSGGANANPKGEQKGLEYTIEKIGPRNYFIKTASGKTGHVGSHSGAILLEKGFLVIDTHASAEVEASASRELFDLTSHRAFVAVNTHHHEDHCGGNSFYTKQKLPVYAHPDGLAELKKVNLPAVAITKSFIEDMRNSDIEIIQVGHAHSTSDVVVYDRKDKILYLGDVFVNGYIGYLGEAEFHHWVKTLNKLIQLDVTTVVPGHGPLAQISDLKYFRDYLIAFARSAKSHFDKTGKIDGYELPKEYQSLGAQFYLPENLEHAFDLWQQGQLNGL